MSLTDRATWHDQGCKLFTRKWPESSDFKYVAATQRDWIECTYWLERKILLQTKRGYEWPNLSEVRCSLTTWLMTRWNSSNWLEICSKRQKDETANF